MQPIPVSFSDTHRFTPIVLDYLQGATSLKPFYTYDPRDPDWAQVMRDKDAEQIDREVLVQVLRRQYAHVPHADAVHQHIEALALPNTYCIVTAHQLNIFTGPLYVIYKTISTIKLCMRLRAQFPHAQFVPIFWLGSEDHDFEEINHTQVFGKTINWNDKQGGACGRYTLDTFAPALEAVLSLLGEGVYAEQLKACFIEAYRPSHNLAHASRLLLHSLFQSYGVVCVDGDDADLKRSCIDMLQDELQHQSSARIMENTLQQFPFPPQAFAREINVFYLDAHLRERIVHDAAANMYRVLNSDVAFTPEALMETLQAHPERFSPNVILRPLMQQKVLPSLAYIGGGGELAYWLQLKAIFAHHHIAFPVLLLRDSFLLVDGHTTKKMQKLGVELTELFAPEHQVIEQYVRRHADTVVDLSAEVKRVEEMFAPLVAQATSIDPGLESTVMAERQNMLNALHKLEAKLLKAQKGKQETQVKQLGAVLQKLFPGGGLQERSESFIGFWLRFGPGFLDILLRSAEQPVQHFTVLVEPAPGEV